MSYPSLAASAPLPKTYHLLRISSSGFSVPPHSAPMPRPASLSQAAFSRPLPTAFSAKKKMKAPQQAPHPDLSPDTLLPAVPGTYRPLHLDQEDQEQQNARKRRSPTEKMEVFNGTGLKPLPLSPSKMNVRGGCFFKQTRYSLEQTYCKNHNVEGDSDDEESEPFPGVDSYPPNFIAYRRRKLDLEATLAKQEDFFHILPDEMVLKVFSFLPKATLGRCTLVSTRFNRLATDDTLWKRVDLPGKILSGDSLATVLTRKPVYFRLARSQIAVLPSTFVESQTQLLYLDLSMAVISQEALTDLLKRCNRLVKLSMEHLEVGKEALVALAACRDLQTLNLTMCYGLDSGALVDVLVKNSKLKELNMGCVKQSWTQKELFKIIFALPIGLTNLNFSGFRGALLDSHIQLLVTRIPDVIDLDLSDSQKLTDNSVVSIVSRLTKVQHLAFSRCYLIEPPVYTSLARIPTLRYLELFSLFKDPSLKTLANAMPGIQLNNFPFSSTARPTVGSRRSSIWGQRVRD